MISVDNNGEGSLSSNLWMLLTSDGRSRNIVKIILAFKRPFGS